MTNSSPEAGFERVLAALERDLLAASDTEIMEVAAEIGLKPDMQGSVALFGVTSTVDVSKLKARRMGRLTRRSSALRR